MSLENIRSECSEVAALLQPHVDGELADAEACRVSDHLEDCDACRAAVSEQMWVRATLRAVEREPAPQALRARVLLSLDDVDREEAAAALPDAPPSLWARMRARSTDLFKGGLVMVPAAAVAAGLFLVARGGLEPVQTMPATGLSTAMTQTTLRDAHLGSVQAVAPKEAVAAAPTAELPSLSELQPQLEFPLQVAPRSPERVQLVGARLDRKGDDGLGARLRYRVNAHEGRAHHIIDQQRPVGGPAPKGARVVFQGQPYIIRHAASGEPELHFEHGGVAHLLTLEGGSGGRSLDVDSPDFTMLLDLAHQLAADPRR
ncbi:MAG: zf-HC2 domain-containing protein [Myxococcota bacterium]